MWVIMRVAAAAVSHSRPELSCEAWILLLGPVPQHRFPKPNGCGKKTQMNSQMHSQMNSQVKPHIIKYSSNIIR